ncbi:MAG: hypothetical protein FWF68_07365 [Spirochaetes bacterium]|nr:hypothetical protein [Spirochaetota bacterium]
MRKSLASRIICIALLYCAAFFFLVILQFSNKGNFLLTAGGMSIRGHFLQSQSAAISADENSGEEDETGMQRITGGIKLFFGGLEFNLKEEREKGLTLAGIDGIVSVNPEYMLVKGNTVRFELPGGTVLVFNSIESSRGNELLINAEFAENISEVTIPVTPRKSTLVKNNGTGIMYNNLLYSFPGQELENGAITLSGERTFISYRSRGKQKVLDPADYIIAQSSNYENAFSAWRDSSFSQWNRNAAVMQNEEDIIAYCAEALVRGGYTAATAAIPGDFSTSTRHSYKSAVFTGGMANAYRTLNTTESDRINLVTRLARERSPDILKEEHIIDYLYTRNNLSLANDVISMINEVDPEMLIQDYCPGLLEAYSDIKRLFPEVNNPVGRLTEKIFNLILENLNHDAENDLVYASDSEGLNMDFSLRLGKAIIDWAQPEQNTEWAAIGRSLILSVLTDSIGSGKFYNILKPGNYNPHAVWLAENGIWAWTVSPSVKASYQSSNLNIDISFPAGSVHYVIIRGIRPFIKLQMHGQDWRTDNQFERYDSSGWVYYQQEQTLILKLKHRTTLENIRIFYRVEAPPVIHEEVEEVLPYYDWSQY